MFPVQILTQISALAEIATAFWASFTGLFEAAAVLAALNLFASLIQKTYAAGKVVGSFWFAYCHEYAKCAVMATIAFVILAAELTYAAGQWTYENRAELAAAANGYRNQIGGYFVYTSPAV